ncbi:MAG: MATE family efflux transporter [Thermoanaerobaculia bacterium]
MEAYGRELRRLWELAIPLAAAQAGMQAMGVVDTAVVGRLGATQLGAIGIANALFFSISIFAAGVVMGIDPLAAQALGAGEPFRARRIMWQGVWLSIFIGGVMSLPLALSPLLLRAFRIDQAIIDTASAYLMIRIASLIPLLVFMVLRAYLQARLVTRPIVAAMVIGNVFNLAADILLVFGGSILPEWCGALHRLPAMGIRGAAIASVLGSLLFVWVLARAIGRIPVESDGSPHRRIHGPEIRHAFRIGLPVGLHMGAEVAVFALVGVLAGTLGEVELAAHQVTLTLAAFTFTVAVGIGSAGSVRVGRAIGAGDREGTRRAGIVAFASGAAFMSLSALVFLTVPGWLALLITDKPRVIAAAIPLLGIAALFQISDGIQGVGAGVLRGAGETRFTFVANILGHWLVGFPVALFFGFYRKMGVVGLWWGLCAGLTVVAALLLARFLVRSARGIKPIAPPITP